MTDLVFEITYSPIVWWAAYALIIALGIRHLVPEEDEPRTREADTRPDSTTTQKATEEETV